MKLKTTSQNLAFTTLVLALVSQIAYVNSVSGIPIIESSQILIGLAIQLLFGIAICGCFFDNLRLPLTLQFSAGFLLGTIPISLLGFVESSGIRLVLVITALLIIRFRYKSHQPSFTQTYSESWSSRIDLERLATALVILNLVISRFETSQIAIPVSIVSIALVIVPRRKLNYFILTYAFILFLTVIVRTLFVNRLNLFLDFRINQDRLLEQAWGNSIISNVSLSDPFMHGQSLQYHFLAFVYDASFTRLWLINPFSFSPAIFACCLLAIVLLFTNSPFLSIAQTFSWWRTYVIVVLCGSWPFWESFALDDNSPGQLLSLCFAFLVLLLIPNNSVGVSILLIPVLITITFLTKSPTGFFIFLVFFLYTFIRIAILDLDIIQRNKPYFWNEFGIPLCGLLLSGIAIVASYTLVFGTPNSGGSASSVRGLGLTLPKIYWGFNWDSQPVIAVSIMFAFAFFPLLSLLILNSSAADKSILSNELSLRKAVTVAIVLNILMALFLKTKFNLNHYFASTGALFGGLTIFGLIKLPQRIIGFCIQFLMTVLLIAAMFLSLKFDAYAGIVTSRIPIFLSFLVFIYLISCKFVFRLGFREALLTAVITLCLGNSIGSSWSPVRWTGYDLRSPEAVKVSAELIDDLTQYIASNHQAFVLAIDLDTFQNSPIQLLIGASSSAQFWAAPNNFMDTSPNYNRRITAQQLLTSNPSESRILLAKSEGVTHVLLSTKNYREHWMRKFDNVRAVYSDSNFTLVDI